MTDAIAPLSAAARMSDADYPGVVGQFGPDWRLVASSDGKRYTLQQLASTDAGPRWVSAGGKSPSTLERICAKYAAQVDGLAALCATLHPDPAAALSLFVEAVRARDAAFEARDVCRADYARVAARDGQIRLAVDPDGLSYVLQWVKFRDQDLPGVRWKRLIAAPSLSPIGVYVLENVMGIDGPGSAGWVRGDDLLPRWQSLIEGLPERADAGVWPVLPPVPGSLQA